MKVESKGFTFAHNVTQYVLIVMVFSIGQAMDYSWTISLIAAMAVSFCFRMSSRPVLQEFMAYNYHMLKEWMGAKAFWFFAASIAFGIIVSTGVVLGAVAMLHYLGLSVYVSMMIVLPLIMFYDYYVDRSIMKAIVATNNLNGVKSCS